MFRSSKASPGATPDALSRALAIRDYLERELYGNPKYAGTRRVTQHGFSVYSQGGEDGILQELWRRLGTTNRFFVEFGVQNGMESNSTYLLLQKWRGLWIEPDRESNAQIRQIFRAELASSQLTLLDDPVDKHNVERLFKSGGVPPEPDLLSVDIDSNDYWVVAALREFRPRVIVVEYNAHYPPPVKWVVEYTPGLTWQGDNYFGASLEAYDALLRSKGYGLVGCEFTGTNAFYVREDLLAAGLFEDDRSAAFHYEPARFFLAGSFSGGHPRQWGKPYRLDP